jgi:oxepin-CoA hydrolase/3-oxo-5,6-dehydrosuberyl-CoA semialdehyde dehydrogenase
MVHNGTRFSAEADSLNASILGADVTAGSVEFDLYVRQLVTEMTAKAGQKCTAIRRAFVPAGRVDAVIEATRERLSQIVVGGTGGMTGSGPEAAAKRNHVGPRSRPIDTLRRWARWSAPSNARTCCARCARSTPAVRGSAEAPEGPGAYLPPILLRCNDIKADEPHEIEAFGPVATVIGYDGTGEVIELVARGKGSLVASLVTADPRLAREIVLGLAPHHGRVLVLNAEDAKESTGHGSPLPMLVHGGPGRAGGGEELGGIRGVLHHMQRTAVQGLAAGLFVDPAPGPVLANFGVDNLRFLTPVKVDDTLTVTLTAKSITPRASADYGEVRWDTVVTNQDAEPVATYDVLTLVAKS